MSENAVNECVTVLIPVKNEEEAIGDVIDELVKLGIRDIVVIDGHSTDRTVEIARRHGAVVYEQPGDGKADAVYFGFRRVRKPFILVIDGDGTYDPSYIPKMLEVAIEGDFDEVLGARRLGRENIPLVNRFGNRILTWLFNMLFGTDLSDVLTGMYLIRSDVARAIIPSAKGFSVEVDIASQVASMGKIAEVPIKYRPRRGSSKLRKWHGVVIGADIIRLMVRYNPVFLLALLVSLLLVPGILLTAYVASQLLLYHINHFIWGIIAFELDSTGLVGLLIAIMAVMMRRVEYRIVRALVKRELQCPGLTHPA